MGQRSMPAIWTRGREALRPATLLTAALACTVITTGAGPAFADTNTGTERSTMLCNVVLFSPGAHVGGCRATQTTGQHMIKKDTANTAVIEYLKLEAIAGLLP